MKVSKLKHLLRRLKNRYFIIHANIGYGVVGAEEVWAIWDDRNFACARTVQRAAEVFLHRHLRGIRSPFPENMPPLKGFITFVVQETGDVLVEVNFLSDEGSGLAQ